MFPGWVWQIKTSFSPIHLWKSTSCYPHSWTSPLSLSADCCSVGTADEKKQGRSVCIREEDRAESVAIKDGRTSVLPVITSLCHGHRTLVSVSACLHPISPAFNHASQSRTRFPGLRSTHHSPASVQSGPTLRATTHFARHAAIS
ncbi:uncharacterized protein LOC122887353 isoform X2 [Siniperca chuatsi]|uniref:uncharacterized protein LOC122887353 isoform X2 n=1 Tax=Siniperca chuatsi TaxID=119488 RepID=UPI001CE1CD82|nr:uncharacterized protein LOC122887353 isoform X2 [Siniperca chuatsi]